MRRFIINIVIREADGFRDVPLRVCDNYEDAEITAAAYRRRNPGYHFSIEHRLGEEAVEWA